jgi:hypothetical protein
MKRAEPVNNFDTTIRIRKDGKTTVKLDFPSAQEAVKGFVTTSLAAIIANWPLHSA